jgi:hypothetical protein
LIQTRPCFYETLRLQRKKKITTNSIKISKDVRKQLTLPTSEMGKLRPTKFRAWAAVLS